MAKFSRKKSVVDINFKDDDCDMFKDVKAYIARQSPEWEEKIADMEKRAQEKKAKKDLINSIFENAPTDLELLLKKIGVWGGIILGALFIIMMSSCFGGNKVEVAPVPLMPSADATSGVVSGAATLVMIICIIVTVPMVVLVFVKGGFFERF